MLNRILVVMLLGMLSSSISAKQYPFQLGDRRVIIDVSEHGVGNNYVHLHSNETTALKAAQRVVDAQGGRLLTLIHNGKRNIAFKLNNKRFEFDPNRIFTPLGIKKSLRRFGRYDKQAAQLVAQFAKEIVRLLPSSGLVVAVHNNRNYSIRNYYKGAGMEADAKAYYKNPKQYYRNFYLVTRKEDFKRFKALGFNVVLQNNVGAEDDGSLSIYLSKQDYINVEAGYDQLKQQVLMLKAISPAL